MIPCGCGCGTLIKQVSRWRERRYVRGHNNRNRDIQVCAGCGEQYPVTRRGEKFCSRDCSARSRVVAKVDMTCLVCGDDYQVFPYRATASKYCSKACWGHRKPCAVCLACGTAFTPGNGAKGKYCSRPCAHTHMVGPRAAQWKGGATLANSRARQSAKLREWRLAVYTRDGFRCRDCGGRDQLHAHHVKFWSTHPELRFNVDNGKTLCIDCHSKVHGKNLRKFRRRTPTTDDRPRARLSPP